MKRRRQLVLVLLLIFTISYTVFTTIASNQANATTKSIQLATTSGEQMTLPTKGSYILNFWATYCPPCEREMPAFEAAYETLQAQNIELYAINVEEPTRLVNQYLTKFDLSFPILLDRDGKLKENYKILTLPTTLFIQDGNVVHTVKGELTKQQVLEFAEKFLN